MFRCLHDANFRVTVYKKRKLDFSNSCYQWAFLSPAYLAGEYVALKWTCLVKQNLNISRRCCSAGLKTALEKKKKKRNRKYKF